MAYSRLEFSTDFHELIKYFVFRLMSFWILMIKDNWAYYLLVYATSPSKIFPQYIILFLFHILFQYKISLFRFYSGQMKQFFFFNKTK